MGNILYQPLGYTILQVIYAFIGVDFGVYYERTGIIWGLRFYIIC